VVTPLNTDEYAHIINLFYLFRKRWRNIVKVTTL